MQISLFGLGYVGMVTAACLAEDGRHHVIAVDTDTARVNGVNNGQTPLHEPGLADLVARCVARQSLSATCDAQMALQQSELVLICVGTPAAENGAMDYKQLEEVCHTIGHGIANLTHSPVIAVRSTILPGTLRNRIIPWLEQASGCKAGRGFHICHNPEFLREGSAIADFCAPAKIIVGTDDAACVPVMEQLYGPMTACMPEVSEMVKYADNAWHATKIVFANEIGNLCKAMQIDSHAVMDIFCQDTKLNISPAYLKPGYAFGGSCLPKDVGALLHQAAAIPMELPLLSSLLPSNHLQTHALTDQILARKPCSVGFLGVAFKAGTDDLRASPVVETIRALLKHSQLSLHIYDPCITADKLHSAELTPLLKPDPRDILHHCDLIVISQNLPEFAALAPHLQPHQQVIDLVRIRTIEETHGNYHGFSW